MKRARINALAVTAVGLPALATLAACGAAFAGNPAAGHRPAASAPPPHLSGPDPGHQPGAAARVSGTLLRVGGPAPGAPVPLTGTVTAVDAAGGRFTATAGHGGWFRLSLPPGTYRLTGHSPSVDSGAGLCAAPRPVHVTRGQPVPQVRVICSIR